MKFTYTNDVTKNPQQHQLVLAGYKSSFSFGPSTAVPRGDLYVLVFLIELTRLIRVQVYIKCYRVNVNRDTGSRGPG